MEPLLPGKYSIMHLLKTQDGEEKSRNVEFKEHEREERNAHEYTHTKKKKIHES